MYGEGQRVIKILKYGSLVELIDTADGETRFLLRDLIKTLTAEFLKKISVNPPSCRRPGLSPGWPSKLVQVIKSKMNQYK